MNYSLNAGEWNSVFAVPASVVDKYIKIAGLNCCFIFSDTAERSSPRTS